jgi:hypothetical protein
LRAIGDQRQTRTGSNLIDTDPRSAGHGGVLLGGAKNKGGENLWTAQVLW